MFNFFRRKKNSASNNATVTINDAENKLDTNTNPNTQTEISQNNVVLGSLNNPTDNHKNIDTESSDSFGVTNNQELSTNSFDSSNMTDDTSSIENIEEANRTSWLSRLKNGLNKTSNNIKHVFVSHRADENLFSSLEDALLLADVGVRATTQVMATLRSQVKKQRIEEATAVKECLKKTLTELLIPLEKELNIHSDEPVVMIMTGVNGAGKTTSIGKLTHHLQNLNKTIILAAGDTFRAAAREQLAVWGERNGVTVIAQESGDPAAVVFDAISSAQAKRTNIVIADTAGRLPTQLNLMDELKKIKRVANKAMIGAPHEIILVLDGSMGQNALTQVKAFDAAVGLTGLIITKLDGTAKGGILAALAVEHPIPIYFIGIGESVQDLQTFDAQEFVDALLD